MRDDTIAAIATPLGRGGVGIVRLSGAEAGEIGARLFDRPLRDRRLVHGRIIDPADGSLIDQALAVLMRAPRTYTREDVVELQCHGGPIVLRRVLAAALALGARSAEPGEFTLRAFLSGRLDLAQAEAVAATISAQTDAAQRLAAAGLEGDLSRRLREPRAALVRILAYISARADFPDEDVPAEDLRPRLAAVRQALAQLAAGAATGAVYREGVRTAIIGRPNVGKSSLLNRLVRRERAIVTDIPGTTRDVIEETVSIDGVPLVLIDTAGINETTDPVERLGIERSRAALAQADLVLLVLDGSVPLTSDDLALVEAARARRAIAVVNKSDLPPAAGAGTLPLPTVHVSARTGEGTEALVAAILACLSDDGLALAIDHAVTATSRQVDALRRALAGVDDALATASGAAPEDMIGAGVREAVVALGEITGDTVTEDLLDAIFSEFCIGK